MGNLLNCCCSDVFEVDKLNENHIDIKNNETPTIQPILPAVSNISGSTEEPDSKKHSYQISLSVLCDENTSELCLISDRIIDVLSIYHNFVSGYDDQHNQSRSISDLISDEFSEYTLTKLRSDFHHLQTYHEANAKYIQMVRDQVDANIADLDDITDKIKNEVDKQTYFGHTMGGEVSMIQTLNEIHKYCTCTDNLNREEPEIKEGDSDESTEYDRNDANDENEGGAVETEQNGIKSNKKKRKKKGYTKSKTKDADDQKEHEDEDDETVQNIDVRYEKEQKKKRKVGKLKLKKPTKKYQNGKYKAGKHKLKNDESWMKQKSLKKPMHTVSESIQMLGNNKLVSKKSSQLEQTIEEEEEFDLSTMDIDIDMSELNADDHEQRVSNIKKNSKIKTPSSMFDDDYDVEVDADDNK